MKKANRLYFKRLAMYIYEKRQIDFSYSICLILAIFNCTRVQRSNKNQQKKDCVFIHSLSVRMVEISGIEPLTS